MFNVRFAIFPPATQELCSTEPVLSSRRSCGNPIAGLIHS
jgi:hypothetical protein